MKLEKIVLNGFKSFADKTEFDFGQGITAIVGPNGCGKSNVVDAVKWVLGDQSPKSLRSGQMADVIFSGSGSRKPSGMSEVCLHFSQVSSSKHQSDQLEITRRLYRSGESEYLINNRPCRLKDIKETFMDTGVGVRAYSIIEQGQIDQLLHASKTDRRVIFEEAAGISKYKAHKKEAVRKLERTEQNLLRLADIVTEVEKQLRSVKLQAGKARNYLGYTERLKELRVNFSLAEYDKLICQKQQKSEQARQIKQHFSQAVAEVGRDDALLSELGSKIIDTENQINRADNNLIAATSKIEQHLDRIEMLREKCDELQKRKTAASAQITALTEQGSQLAGELDRAENDLKTYESTHAQKQQTLTEMQKELADINRNAGELEARLEDEKSGVIDSIRKTTQLHNEIQTMSNYRDSLAGQKNKLSGKADQFSREIETLLTDKAMCRTKLDDINKVIQELQDTLAQKRQLIEQVDSDVAAQSSSLARQKESLSALTSECSVLKDMQQRREGLNKSVKDILNMLTAGGNDCRYIDGILADIISTDEKYAHAVEAALLGTSDSLIVNSTAAFLADTELRDNLAGRVNVIFTDRIAPLVDTFDLSSHSAVLGRLAEFVNYPPQHAQLVWSLFAKVLLVETLEDAIELSSVLDPGFSYVTPDGKFFDGNASAKIGPLGKTSGIISRRSRINKLMDAIAQSNAEIRRLQQQLDDKNRQCSRLEELCKNLRTSIYEANTEKVDTQSRLKLIEDKISRITDEQPVISNEIQTLEQQISDSVKKEHDSRQKLEEMEEINSQREQNIAQLEKQFSAARDQARQCQAQLTEIKVDLSRINEQRNSANQKIAGVKSQIRQSRLAIESARSEMDACSEQSNEAHRNILKSEAAVSELYVEKETSQNISTQLHEQVRHLIAQRESTGRALKEKRETQSRLENQMHQFELELNEIKVKMESLSQRVSEELDIDLAQAYENFEKQEIDFQQVRDEIDDLRGKIERLGNVNVDAIEQQQQLEERFRFLSEQVSDLTTSKAQLEQLIEKINTESTQKFTETFHQVRENFQQLFRKLFGGGKADILLDDPDDVLESGIEIMAKPPGKETRSISLLSGGEKTMTAIALQFSIFQSKPSPFCFLDEVDAALDEANNERFNMIVQEFQKDSQFIIVTHSKRTMSIADILFGVTMQTRGVSKKISVKFDQTETAVA